MATTNFSTSLGRYIKSKGILFKKVREYWEEKRYFLGIVTVKDIIKTDTLSVNIAISTDQKFDQVFVNGEEYIKKI